MANFNEINTVSKADTILKAATPAWVKVNGLYMMGNHFQNGTQWIGPPPPPEEYAAAMQSLEKVFVPSPVSEEMVEGHVSGAVGREPAFEMALARDLDEGEEYTPEELTAKAEVDAEIAQWFDDRNVLSLLQEWVGRLKWASRGTLRLWVPPEQLNEEGDEFVVDATEVSEALDSIYLECPNVEAATVTLDRRSMRTAGLYRYDEKVTTETGRTQTRKCVELVFVAGKGDEFKAGQTVMRVIEDKKIVAEIAFPCGGYSLLYEGYAPVLLTDPVIRNQRALNMINTMLPLNDAYAGFRTRDLFNVTEPTDENGEKTDAASGPATSMMWHSVPYTVEGETKYLPPQLIVTEPVNTEQLRADIEHFDHIIRRSCKQFHTVLSGSDVQSAVSRIQARAVFLIDLYKTTPVVEDALRWLQPAVYCFALYLCGKESEIPAFLETYRATASCKPYTGPLTPEEVRILIEMVNAGLISQEFARALFGVDDLNLEMQRLEREMGDNLTMQIQRAELFAVWSKVFDAPLAAEMAGLSEEQVATILKNQSGGTDE